MAAMRRLREDLRAWRLPLSSRPASGGRRWRLPAWIAAAAVLVLAAGAAITLAGVETGWESGRFFFRLGRADLRQALAAQEARALAREKLQREEIEALRASLEVRPAPGVAEFARFDAQIDEKIRQSEARQARQIEATLAGWTERTQAQRRLDLARVAAGLSYLDGRHGEQLARTNELMSYVLEAAAQKR
jgi:hypothetical protein